MTPGPLRINADDFGLCPSVSEGIAACAREGLLHSLSVLPFTDEPQRRLLQGLAADLPHLRIGLHLSLFDAPLLSPALVPLLGPRPSFKTFFLRYLQGRLLAPEVRREWQAQKDWLTALLGREPDHYDGHRHLHLLPFLFPIAAALAGKNPEAGQSGRSERTERTGRPGSFRTGRETAGAGSFPRLRIPFAGSLSDPAALCRAVTYKFPLGLLLQALAGYRCGFAPRALFLGFEQSLAFRCDVLAPRLFRALEGPRAVEIMVHPGFSSPAARERFGAWGAQWEAEIGELRRLRAFLATTFPALIPPSLMGVLSPSAMRAGVLSTSAMRAGVLSPSAMRTGGSGPSGGRAPASSSTPTTWADFWRKKGAFRIFSYRHGLLQARHFLSRSRTLFPLGPEDSLLDFGCGPGYVATCLTPFPPPQPRRSPSRGPSSEKKASLFSEKPSEKPLRRYLGVDISEEALSLRRGPFPPGFDFRLSPPPAAEGGFDLGLLPEDRFTRILCLSVVQYLPHPDRLFDLLKALLPHLAPGGRMLIADIPILESARPGFLREVLSTLREALRAGGLSAQLLFFVRAFFSPYREARRRNPLQEWESAALLAKTRDLLAKNQASSTPRRAELFFTALTFSPGRAHLLIRSDAP